MTKNATRSVSISVPRRFLVIRTDRMGDVILSTPVLSAIKHNFPDSFVAMLVRPYAREIVSGHPHLDRVFVDDKAEKYQGVREFLTLAGKIRRQRFDVALVLHPTFRLALLTVLAGIPIRVGTRYRAYSWLFNRRVAQHRKKSSKHELELNLEIAAAVGAKLDRIRFYFFIPPQADEKVRCLLKKNGIGAKSKFVVLHPGSGGSAWDWPAERFAQLAQRLVQELGIRVILTGSKQEIELVNSVAALSKVKPIKLAGQLNIKELAALLKQSALTIANSTGPLHLATAVGAQVIGLYYPMLPYAPSRWGPYRRPDSVIMPPKEKCREMAGDRLKHGNCMEFITVEQVYQKAREMLGFIESD